LERGPLTAPFWEAARRKELALQRCTTCERMHHPPVQLCPDCRGTTFDWRVVTGTGTVYEYSVLRAPQVGGFEAMVPYACIAVEIDEQPGLIVMGNLLDVPPEAARVGMRVGVRFEPYGADDLLLPQFAPLEGDGSK
jgi:uncharacterized OB-fold protein